MLKNIKLKNIRLKNIYNKAKLNVDFEEFMQAISEKNLPDIYSLNLLQKEEKFTRGLFEAYYFFGIEQFEKSFTSSFFVIEHFLRKKYSETSSQSADIKSGELLKWAKNRRILSDEKYYHIMGFRIRRNKIVHHLEKCTKEEALMILRIVAKL